jgi:5-methylthioadenosine/S-adenosylhomocysteine deaminase
VIGCLQMLKSGTTAVIDHFPEQGFTLEDVGVVVRAFEDCGMRAVVALRIFDEPYSDILPPPERRSPGLLAALADGNSLAPRPLAESLDIVREAIAVFDRRAQRIRIFPAPSNPVRCSDALLTACEEIAARHDTGVHCHMLETRAQVTIAQERYGTTVIEHMHRIGAFSGRWSNAHCNWVSDAEIGLMAEHGSVAVLNPESNLKIGSGIPPIPKLVAADVPCALGTDGASTNDNLILQDAMQLAAILHRPSEPDRRRWVTVADVMGMATLRRESDGRARPRHRHARREGGSRALRPQRDMVDAAERRRPAIRLRRTRRLGRHGHRRWAGGAARRALDARR